MDNNKKLVYGLLGGAALVGAAIAFYYLNKETSEDTLEDDLDQIGEL